MKKGTNLYITMTTKRVDWNDELVKEVHSFLKTLKTEPIEITKNPILDMKNKQFLIKLPMSIISKFKIKKDSEFSIVANPDRKIREKINESKFVIYLKNE